ncbi:4'-phosphopantetheinyl transferase family protein [Metabacillus fastidiosus]|uniref:4'-phosphopantetheinyl transferase family protein n=1 Tax=Metabacillus fastidiosus TaxID=1458 RepID=UPI003D2AE853
MTIVWNSPKLDNLELAPNELHIWRASLNLWTEYKDILGEKLSIDEHERAEKFVFEKDKSKFIAGRYILRMLIGLYLSIPFENVQFVYGYQGKPIINPIINSKKLCFNISHSGNIAVYIFAINRSLGIDIEYTRKQYKGQSIIERWFTNREQMIYSQLSQREKQQYFYKAWTLKEAYLKGLGKGLEIPLEDIELLPDNQHDYKNNYGFKDWMEGMQWHLSTFVPFKDFLGAYAIRNEKEAYHIKWWDLADVNFWQYKLSFFKE